MMAMDLKALAKAGMQNDIAEIVELNVPVKSKKRREEATWVDNRHTA